MGRIRKCVVQSPGVSLGGLLALLTMVSSAGAQDSSAKSPPVLKPVQVIATRRPEAPHDVPASIEVITGANLRARGARSLQEALQLAAGLSIAPGGDGGPASAVPEFWGLREFDAFLLVVDNVPWGGALNPAIASASLRDVERIEILRGPAPVTYGATSFVGVIHVVHRSAAESTRGVEAYGGTYGSGGVGLDFATPLGSWHSRMSGDFDHSGFKDDNTAFSKTHLLFRTSAPGGGYISADVNILRQDPASPHPREGPELSSAVPLDANHNPNGAYLNEDRFQVAAGWESTLLNGIWGTTASLAHSTQNIFRGFLTAIENVADNASGFKEEIEINDIYVDTHLLWGGESKLRTMAGADALIAQGEGKGATFSYTAPLDGATRANVTEPSNLNLDSEDERAFFGLYGSLEWRPTSRFSGDVGLRLNNTNEKRGEGEEVSHSTFSGSIGASYGIWEQEANHLRAFVSYRDTFKPAAFDFGLAENEGVLEPETSTALEAGLKFRTMEGRLDIDASVFDMDFENLVTSTIVNNLPALINAGKTSFKGVEIAADYELPKSMFARATYSFHDGKFKDFVQDFDGELTQLGGNRFEMSPQHLASVGLTLSPDRGFIANLGANYVGDRYLNKRNTALVDAYSTWDAGIGWRAERYEVRFDARNLSDARDVVSESEFGDAQYYRMTARSLRLGMNMRY
ncbi:MAG TPA: TonB-dependent receptor [Gemmatimonadaceae bacterium]|nr:TonB-dependent receptor [Gemmatimonadaceae bacterium]